MNARRSMIPAFAPNAVAFSGIPDERASSISRSRACPGLWLCGGEVAPHSRDLNFPVTRRDGVIALILFTALLLIPPLVVTATGSQGLALFDAFYRSGALVFGGGHVVLPLLQAQVVTPGWVTNEAFLAGYGLAQAVAGTLLTLAGHPWGLTVPPAER